MEVESMKLRVRPYKGRWCSRKLANQINDMLLSAQKPDFTQLEKEASEFENYIRQLRKNAQV